ncbi:MAG: dockerin type I repeat-containing protein [Prevotella sp.]|nr:dockerin type I repeat-containing protein [Prevotella sp.]
MSIPASEDFQEVEWEVAGCTNSGGGFICVQPGTSEAAIEWKSLTVSHNAKAAKPVTWMEWLTSDGQSVIVETKVENIPTWMGNAETPWADPNVKFNDQENNYLICAWGKEREVNMNDDGGWDPFPATIEQEESGNHYFIVHGNAATTEGDAAAWDNQFWIQSPREWKSGTALKITFRYKASKNVTVATQCHKQNPSDYLIWHAIGDIAFTTEWQTFEGTMNIADDMSGTWSIAFQLNQNDKDAIDFYFDDLSWQSMKLDEGLFVASSNTVTGVEYDFDNATEFVVDEYDDEVMVATVGTPGKQDTWVNEVMISTIRGNDAAFKGATIKPTAAIVSEEWIGYETSSLAKIKLPAAGVWKIEIAPSTFEICFTKIEGEEDREPLEEIANPTEVVINAPEREPTATEQPKDEEAGIEEGTGQPWDSQFWILANRELSTGESTIIKFKYMAATPATASTQCHAAPGAYLHWAAIGNVEFTEEWQEFEQTFTVPAEADKMQSIAFNLSELRDANIYKIKDVVWMTSDMYETLIDTEGTKNFMLKEGANTAIFEFGHKPSDEQPIKGDVNNDKEVDVADISAILTVMSGDTSKFSLKDANVNGDLDNDGNPVVDVADISSVLTIMAGGTAE